VGLFLWSKDDTVFKLFICCADIIYTSRVTILNRSNFKVGNYSA
jgi:hypothetical protein